MLLKRKSDGFVICDAKHIRDWSPWYSLAVVNQIPTRSGVLYPQPWGVEQEAMELQLMFAAHFPTATPAAYNALVRSWRKNQTLQFTDFEGVTSDVRVISALDSSANERWTEVRTKNIRFTKVEIMKLEYTA